MAAARPTVTKEVLRDSVFSDKDPLSRQYFPILNAFYNDCVGIGKKMTFASLTAECGSILEYAAKVVSEHGYVCETAAGPKTFTANEVRQVILATFTHLIIRFHELGEDEACSLLEECRKKIKKQFSYDRGSSPSVSTTSLGASSPASSVAAGSASSGAKRVTGGKRARKEFEVKTPAMLMGYILEGQLKEAQDLLARYPESAFAHVDYIAKLGGKSIKLVTTILIEAASQEDPDFLQLVLQTIDQQIARYPSVFDKYAVLNDTDSDGNTALLWATGKGWVEQVHLLLAAGASITKGNLIYDTPIASARRILAGEDLIYNDTDPSSKQPLKAYQTILADLEAARAEAAIPAESLAFAAVMAGKSSARGAGAASSAATVVAGAGKL